MTDDEIDAIVSYATTPLARFRLNGGIPAQTSLDRLASCLAEVLDWPLRDVQDALLPCSHSDHVITSSDPEELMRTSGEAYRAGQYSQTISIARRMHAVATTPRERAMACNRELGGWGGLGHYQKVAEVARRGLREPDIPHDIRRQLESNLANAHLCLWHLQSAERIATRLITWYRFHAPSRLRDAQSVGFAYYVRGSAYRRQIGLEQEPGRIHDLGFRVRSDLLEACTWLESCSSDDPRDPSAAVANTCRGGLLEAAAATGLQDPGHVLDTIASTVHSALEGPEAPAGEWLESHGWWCLFGCNVAIRHLGDSDAVRHVRLLLEYGNRVTRQMQALNADAWSLQEGLFSAEHRLRQRCRDSLAWSRSWTKETIAAMVGTMGRIPHFRMTGRDLLLEQLACQG